MADLFAFLALRNKLTARGRNMMGRTTAHMAYPHLQFPAFNMAAARIGPIHTFNKNGVTGRLRNNARFSRLLVSAIKICWRIWRPVNPAAWKI